MDTMAAFMMGAANRGREQKVFDWDKAAQIIKEQGITEAHAGLSEDFGNTGGMILEDGKPIIDGYTYLASTWATPVLVIFNLDDLDDGLMEIPCYIMQSQTEWDAYTKWPQSALDILTCDVQKEPKTDEPNYR